MQIKFDEQELQMIALVLSKIAVKDRTGEFGLIHGANRFVSTNVPLKKAERQKLSSACRKLGIKEPSSV